MADVYWSDECEEDPHTTVGQNLNKALVVCMRNNDGGIGEDIHEGRQACTMSFFTDALLMQLCGGDPMAVNADAALINPVFQVDTAIQWSCKFSGKDSDPSSVASFGIDVTIDVPRTGLSLMEYLRANYFSDTIYCRCGCQQCDDNRTMGLTTTGKPERRDPKQTQRKTIVRGPEILVIRFMRYSHKTDRNGQYVYQKRFSPETGEEEEFVVEVKYAHQIDYDEFLDLSEFSQDGKELKYRLDGVVSHQGKSTSHGHYICHVREDGKVKEFDDEDTYELPGEVSEALKRPEAFEGNQAFTPYVLVYSKI